MHTAGDHPLPVQECQGEAGEAAQGLQTGADCGQSHQELCYSWRGDCK